MKEELSQRIYDMMVKKGFTSQKGELLYDVYFEVPGAGDVSPAREYECRKTRCV